jgi:hypothetical protein
LRRAFTASLRVKDVHFSFLFQEPTLNSQIREDTMKNQLFIRSLTRGLPIFAFSALALTLAGCATTSSAPTRVASSVHCGGLEGEQEVLSRLYKPGAHLRAAPVKERVFKARANQPIVTMGATISLPAEAEMNGPYLHRVLACHAQFGQSAHPNDPLHPQSGSVSELMVRESGNSYSIEILSDDPKVGEEIWKRADSLSRGHAEVQIEQVGSRDRTVTSNL